MNKMIAEFLGTMALVLIGCGTAVLGGSGMSTVGIAMAFGLAIITMAYAIGHISGCHVNPAVSVGAFVAGRMSSGDLVKYIIAQCLGAVAGAALVYCIASGKAGYDLATNGLGQNGWGTGYLGEYSMHAALVFEFVATFLFVSTILGVTRDGSTAAVAGLVIGLTLIGIHLLGIQVTGVSVNPARSFGPALFVGGTALSQLWLFIVAPLAGAVAAGFYAKCDKCGLASA